MNKPTSDVSVEKQSHEVKSQDASPDSASFAAVPQKPHPEGLPAETPGATPPNPPPAEEKQRLAAGATTDNPRWLELMRFVAAPALGVNIMIVFTLKYTQGSKDLVAAFLEPTSLGLYLVALAATVAIGIRFADGDRRYHQRIGTIDEEVFKALPGLDALHIKTWRDRLTWLLYIQALAVVLPLFILAALVSTSDIVYLRWFVTYYTALLALNVAFLEGQSRVNRRLIKAISLNHKLFPDEGGYRYIRRVSDLNDILGLWKDNNLFFLVLGVVMLGSFADSYIGMCAALLFTASNSVADAFLTGPFYTDKWNSTAKSRKPEPLGDDSSADL